jgi:hypothetical protein
MFQRYSAREQHLARELAERVNTAVANAEASGLDFKAKAEAIIEECRGVGGGVYMCYDDACGDAVSWTKPAGSAARQVRNHPIFGRLLNDAVNATPAKKKGAKA